MKSHKLQLDNLLAQLSGPQATQDPVISQKYKFVDSKTLQRNGKSSKQQNIYCEYQQLWNCVKIPKALKLSLFITGFVGGFVLVEILEKSKRPRNPKPLTRPILAK